MNKEILKLLLLLPIALFVSCNMNDYKPEYQKDIVYDGLHSAIDSVSIKTYYVTDSIPQRGELYSEVTKWYDVNGYISMIRSIIYSANGKRQTTEMITRDKNSLPIARDIIIEVANTEPAVTLSRLRKRKNGVEEWLYRHYLDAQKFVEDANTMTYTASDRTIKKNIGDSLSVIEIENYDSEGRIVYRQPILSGNDHPHVHTYYSDKGLIDSLVAYYYTNNNPSSELLKSYTEKHEYVVDSLNNPVENCIYRNDSLSFISESEYAYRK